MTVLDPSSASCPAQGPRRTRTTKPVPLPRLNQSEPMAGRTLIRTGQGQQAGTRNQDDVIACHEPRSHGGRRCSRAVGCPDRCGRRHA
jgi:hypothetical protein